MGKTVKEPGVWYIGWNKVKDGDMLGVKDASGSTGKKRAEDGSQAKGRDETRGM